MRMKQRKMHCGQNDSLIMLACFQRYLECINFLQELPLCMWVLAKQVDAESQSAGSCLISRQHHGTGLPCDLAARTLTTFT